MEKTDIELQMTDSADWLEDAKIAIFVEDLIEGGQYDGHITSEFEDLNQIEDLEEEQEGTLMYYGDLTLSELQAQLLLLGYDVVIGTAYD